MNWIPTTERLPTEADAPDGRVLVCFAHEPGEDPKYWLTVYGWRSRYLQDPGTSVTHWCAIPKLPS